MIYKTQDLWLAVALDATGHQLTGLEKAEENRVTFIFTTEEYVKEDVDGYFSGVLEAPVVDIMMSLKKLKTRISGLLKSH